MCEKKLLSPFNLSDYTLLNRPRYLIALLYLFKILSLMISHFQSIALKNKWIKIPSLILEAPDNYFCTIRKIWLTRMLRRTLSFLIRTPLRYGTLALINYNLTLPPKSGCVIAIPHTPWSRLLAEWCRVNNYALVLVGGPWIKRTGRINIPGGGFSGIRRLIKHLRSGGRVIVIGDNIDRWRCCPVRFFGRDCFASILPVRIAAFVGVPLLAVYPKFEDGLVNIYNGFEASIEEIKTNEQKVIQKVFNYYENEIRRSPSIYEPYILKSLNRLSSIIF